MYLDYDFYNETYGGQVPLDKFKPLEIQASRTVKHYTFGRIGAPSEDVKFAVCELVDYLYQLKQTGGKEISSESVGSHSISYVVDKNTSVEKRKKDIIRSYLDHTGLMYRGV